MKFKYSAISLSVICFFSSVTYEPATQLAYLDEDGYYNVPSFPLLRGVGWSVNTAFAACDYDRQDSSCREDQMEVITVYGDPNAGGNWWHDPMGGYNPDPAFYGDPENRHQGGGGSSLDPDNKTLDSNQKEEVIESMEQVTKYLDELIDDISDPNKKDVFKQIKGHLLKTLDKIKSAERITTSWIENNYDKSFEISLNITTALTVATGLKTILSNTTLPGAIVNALVTIAAPTAGEIVEDYARDNELYQRLVDAIRESTGTNLETVDSNGNTYRDSLNQTRCRIRGYCMEIPPIILDLETDGIEMSELESSKAYFDFDKDGFVERLSWLTSNDAFLYVDLNENGILDSYKEFAIAHLAGEGKTDLDGLKTLDENGDRTLDRKDEAFQHLGLWKDNGDAKIEQSEMYSLSDVGITSISLAGDNEYRAIGSSMIKNTFTYSVRLPNGQNVTRAAYDVGITANENGEKIVESSSYRLTLREETPASIDFSKSSNPLSFSLGTDDIEETSNISALRGGASNDFVITSSSASVYIDGYLGDDQISGGPSDDMLIGNFGHDEVNGGRGKDYLKGGVGDDHLYGGDDNDRLEGAAGNDWLNGGRGIDYISGGDGSDIFEITQGLTIISDFEKSRDKLLVNGMKPKQIESSLTRAKNHKSGMLIRFTRNAKVYLKGYRVGDIEVADFKLN
jgi:Ca2+-binding RTX toxin-like protein